jgi:enoyl-CoA hydratase/carnithine racemase
MNARPKVRFVREGALGTLLLDNPPLNLIDEQLIGDMLAAISEVEAADSLRALLLRSDGKVFSAGADVALLAGMDAHRQLGGPAGSTA